MREKLANDKFGTAYNQLDEDSVGLINATVVRQIKNNRYDKANDTLVLTNSNNDGCLFSM